MLLSWISLPDDFPSVRDVTTARLLDVFSRNEGAFFDVHVLMVFDAGVSVLFTSTKISTQPLSSGVYLSSWGPHVFSCVSFSSWLRHRLACHTSVTDVRIARGAWP